MCVFTRMGTSSYNSLCLQGELRVLHVLILIRIHWLPCKRAETTEHGVWDTSDLHQEEMFPVQETITITPSMLQDKVAVSVNYPWGFCHANISCVIGVGKKRSWEKLFTGIGFFSVLSQKQCYTIMKLLATVKPAVTEHVLPIYFLLPCVSILLSFIVPLSVFIGYLNRSELIFISSECQCCGSSRNDQLT